MNFHKAGSDNSPLGHVTLQLTRDAATTETGDHCNTARLAATSSDDMVWVAHLNPCNPATGPRKTFFHNPITRTYCRYLVHDICIYVYCIWMYQRGCLNSNFLRCQGLESSQGLGPPSPTGLPSLGHFAPLLNEPNLVIGALPSRTVDFFLGFIGDGDGEGL